MTNFEKWKEGLTPEWVAAFMERYSIHCGCYECPAEWYHKHGEAKGRNGCRKVFLEWANAPAEEENEDDRLPEGWTREEIFEAAKKAKAEEASK